jgi:hypothetical protein
MGSVKGILAICFNKRKENDFHESRCAEIKNAESLLSKKKKIKSGLEVYFDEKGRINKKALEEAEEFDGYSCLFR